MSGQQEQNSQYPSSDTNGVSAPSQPNGQSLPRMPQSNFTSGMTTSSTPLGNVNAARGRPPGPMLSRGPSSNAQLTGDLAAKMRAFQLTRQGKVSTPVTEGTPKLQTGGVPASGAAPSPVTPAAGGPAFAGGVPANFRLPSTSGSAGGAPALKMGGAPGKMSLAEKRGLSLPGGLPGQAPAAGTAAPPAGGRKKPGLSLSQINGGEPSKDETKPVGGSMMDKYAEYLDPKTGTLRFAGKAVLSATGVEFSSGSSFSISLDEVDTLDELGKGNYGTVYKVRHSRPKIRKVGGGLGATKSMNSADPTPSSPTSKQSADWEEAKAAQAGGTTGIVMAMKEIRLELDDAKFAAIIMELDILHKCISPFIVDFYGAFFQEGAVYICMEFMDGGSIDKIYGDGIPEGVLRKITYATTSGLRVLKDEHNIIHRDVKPTNVLMNTRGQIKICDFGVSGNLVASFAKTNIGCQSYMAPERISTGAMGGGVGNNPGSYSVQSDIWSLGLTIIECSMGRYPYPPETYNNIFSQLSAIVDGEPPDLPKDGYSDMARDFVRGCLHKIPKMRPTYARLLDHPWIADLNKNRTTAILEEEEEEDGTLTSTADPTPKTGPAPVPTSTRSDLPANVVDVEVASWVLDAIEKKRKGKLAKNAKPALHAAPLDAIPSPAANSEGPEGPGIMVEPKDV